jgi:hypothetical protein
MQSAMDAYARRQIARARRRRDFKDGALDASSSGIMAL